MQRGHSVLRGGRAMELVRFSRHTRTFHEADRRGTTSRTVVCLREAFGPHGELAARAYRTLPSWAAGCSIVPTMSFRQRYSSSTIKRKSQNTEDRRPKDCRLLFGNRTLQMDGVVQKFIENSSCCCTLSEVIYDCRMPISQKGIRHEK